jgi:N-formylmaleamate deformylase
MDNQGTTQMRRSILGLGLLLVAACAGTAPAAKPAPVRVPAPTTTYAFDVTVTGAGKPLILIPGLSCDGRVWDATVAHYRGHYQLHVLTLAGFGGARAAIPAPFLATVRQDLARYIRTQKLDHPVVVGHSLGGFMALWLAAREPDLLGGVVAVDGVPYLAALQNPAVTAESMAQPAQLMHDRIAGLTPEAWAAESKRTLPTMITDPAEVERVHAGAAASSPVAVANAVFEMLTTDLRPEVAKITVPTLVLQSTLPDTSFYERQVATIKDHRVVAFPKAKHFIMLDAPAEFFATVDEFLTKAAR